MEKEIAKRICPDLESEGFKNLEMVKNTYNYK
jgi:hypothetical protein